MIFHAQKLKTRSLTSLVIAVGTVCAAGANAAPLSSNQPAPYRTALEQVINDIRPQPRLETLQKFVSNTPKIPQSLKLEDKALRITKYIFKEWNIEADNTYQSRDRRDNILPDSVLAVKRGHCVGLTALFLLAAEKNGFKAGLVRTPEHVFPRLCDEKKCINIEMLRNGENKDDAYYIENLSIPNEAIEKGLYLKTLHSSSELTASIYTGLGYVAVGGQQLDLAELFYRLAMQNSPNFADPISNLAGVLAAKGDMSTTRNLLEAANAKNPYHFPTTLNLGIYHQKQSAPDKALEFYTRATQLKPTSAQAFLLRANLLRSQGKPREALMDLERILIIQPDSCEIIEQRDELANQFRIARSVKTKDPRELKKQGRCIEIRAQ